jgi:hypothetical protein
MIGDKEYTEGESRYCARELLNNLENDSIDPCKADMFSLGMFIYVYTYVYTYIYMYVLHMYID